MSSKVYSASIIGLEALPVEVEVDISHGLSIFNVLEKTQLFIISDNLDLMDVSFDPDNMEAITLGPQLQPEVSA